jgi:hypothetical protein
MKKSLFVAVVSAAICAGAQQSSQPKSNDQAVRPQPAAQPAQPQSDNAAQPQTGKNAQPSDTNAALPKDAAADKETASPQTATTPTAAPAASKGCLAVQPIGSHVFRNVMLLGVTGALISKQQYQVKDVVNYPVSVGTKFHGDDLQTISSGGTKVVVLDKHYKEADLQKACH